MKTKKNFKDIEIFIPNTTTSWFFDVEVEIRSETEYGFGMDADGHRGIDIQSVIDYDIIKITVYKDESHNSEEIELIKLPPIVAERLEEELDSLIL